MQTPNFKPFTLVVAAFTSDSYGDCPLYAEICITAQLLAEVLRIARIAKDAKIRIAHIDGSDGIWSDPGNALIMQGTDLVVMPSSYGGLQETSFFWQAHPKHAAYDCQTKAIDIKDLLACIGHAEPELPTGFRRERDVLFYDADSDVIDELIEQYLTESAEEFTE